jgi:mono/diheme cytochrome c family protein
LFFVASLAASVGVYASACSDDSDVNPTPTVDGGSDATVTPDTGGGGFDGGTDAGDVARGKYLVTNVASCPDCHTPRNPDGSPDMTRWLAGVECLAGTPPSDAGAGDAGDAGPSGPGCLNSRNLTNDATGLKNRSDQEIKDMFQNGTRPNGERLSSFMPYWVFHNFSTADADAIVAYLRSVPGVNHNVPPSDPVWLAIFPPAQPLADSQVPTPAPSSANLESAKRGRYLATIACLDCHTPDAPPGSPQPSDLTQPFAGSRAFPAALLHLPTPPFPAIIYTQNLTQDSTGLLGYTSDMIVRELKQGLDKDGGGICPPMPAGPKGGFGGLTDGDALDIANYILTLPPISKQRPANCVAP